MFIQNLLSKRATVISPFEALFGSKPTAKYFNAIGQRVYVLKSDLSGKKPKPLFDEAVYLGFDEKALKI